MESISDRVTVEVAFDKYDADDSGFIDKGELQALVAELDVEMDDAELEEGMRLLDTDGSGKIEKVCYLIVHTVVADACV